MKIRVNRNIDNYRPDVFHGLDFSQTMHALGCVVAGSSAFLFSSLYLHIPQTACFYIAMAFAFPVAAAGFLKIGGMTPVEYLKKRREIRRMPVYFYCPEVLGRRYLPEDKKESTGKDIRENKKPKKGKEKELFLDDAGMPISGKESFQERGRCRQY